MPAGIAVFSCGVILLYWTGVVPPSNILMGGALLIPGLLLLSVRGYWPTVCRSLAWGLAGLLWASTTAVQQLHAALPAALEGPVQTVSGYLCDLPADGAWHSVRFSLCVEHWRGQTDDQIGVSVPARLRLAWYGKDATRQLPPTLRVKVRLKRPHGADNPVGFRYETWLFRHDYGATGSVRSLQALPSGECAVVCRYHQWRKQLADGLARRLGDLQQFALVNALLLGDRGDLTNADWQTLKATGTIHLVAISGLHIGLIALGIGLCAGFLLRYLPQHWLAPSRRRWLLFVLASLASVSYALAAGFTVPTQRALIMLTLAGLTVIRAGRSSPWMGWLLALALVLLLDSRAPLGRGFWLSFGAVAVLILVFAGRVRSASASASLVLAQCAVFAGLWPALAMMDQSPAPWGWLANLIAIPYVSLVVLPVIIAGGLLMMLVPSLTDLVGALFDKVLELLWWFLRTLEGVPAPVVSASAAVAASVAVVALAALWMPDWRLRCLTLALLVSSLVLSCWPEMTSPAQNSWVTRPEIWVWDVGQGLSVMVRDRDQVLVYDTGPESPSGFNAVDSVILPNLRALGVHRINTLIVSHADGDHSGGLGRLLQAMSVDRVISGEPTAVAAGLTKPGVPGIEPCRPSTSLNLARIGITLWAWRPDASRLPSGNEASCVALLRYGDDEVILPGDIPAHVESALVRTGWFGQPMHRLLVAAHHGSRTASAPAWVKAVDPDYVVFTAGYRHRYGHPHPIVVRRFRKAGAETFNTAYAGAVRFRLDQHGIMVHAWRDDVPFWLSPLQPTPQNR